MQSPPPAETSIRAPAHRPSNLADFFRYHGF